MSVYLGATELGCEVVIDEERVFADLQDDLGEGSTQHHLVHAHGLPPPGLQLPLKTQRGVQLYRCPLSCGGLEQWDERKWTSVRTILEGLLELKKKSLKKNIETISFYFSFLF